MANYIAIDGGTTNTRISLVKNGVPIATKKYNVGAKKSIDGNTELKKAVKEAIQQLLNDAGMLSSDIECILAAGMITSEFGLFELKHITVPAGIAELHKNMKRVVMEELSDIPFVFIPGIKLNCTSLEDSDMMRGEEAELMGIDGVAESVYVLPGSHSKVIRTDGYGRITDFCTMLTGEMIEAISGDTILRDAVDLSLGETERDFLLSGYSYCEKNGLNKSLFKVRVLKNLLGATPVQVYSFFLGAMFHDEIKQIISCDEKTVVIGGKRQLRSAMAEIIQTFSDKKVWCLSDAEVENANILGMVKIYERID